MHVDDFSSICPFAMLAFTPQILLQSLLTYFEKKQSRAHLLKHLPIPKRLSLFCLQFIPLYLFQTNILKETLLEKVTFKCFSFLRLLLPCNFPYCYDVDSERYRTEGGREDTRSVYQDFSFIQGQGIYISKQFISSLGKSQ